MTHGSASSTKRAAVRRNPRKAPTPTRNAVPDRSGSSAAITAVAPTHPRIPRVTCGHAVVIVYQIKDSLIAPTALVHDLVVATHNPTDFEKAGIEIVDPFTA